MGSKQADEYFNNILLLLKNPYSFEAVDYLRSGYRRCPCGSKTIYYRVIKNEIKIMGIIGREL